MFACVVLLMVYTFSSANSVPPEVCFAPFRWDDCGAPPKEVMYYYKPGSRCEAGSWRGCLPNPNMFADEFECIDTCIYGLKAQPHDYHKIEKPDFPRHSDPTTKSPNVTNT